ncbi:hypothetical protein KFE98_02965 [bacterium SCSIO 12741]|nr:hypothetical protein KFE98_02965 [bacterium SCSIO 12741]
MHYSTLIKFCFPISAILFALFGTNSQAHAQLEIKNPTLSLGYFGQGVIRPGVRLGLDFQLKSFSKEKVKGEVTKTKRTTFFGGPHLAHYTRPSYYSNYLIEIRGGLERQTEGKGFYSALSAGLGYQLNLEVMSFDVDFSGRRSNIEREARHFFFPSLRYEAGYEIGRRWRVYLGLTYGVELSGSYEATSQGFLEGGFKYKLQAP